MAPESHESAATNESNPTARYCEDGNVLSENDVDDAIDRLDDESGESEGDGDVVFMGALTAIHGHSEQVFVYFNADAHHNELHYTCTSCVSLAKLP